MARQHIVIVEDETKIAQVLSEFLSLEGFTSTLIEDGAEAVDSIRQLQPTAVILDLMLPNKSGLDICKEVRTFSNVPILMLTARVEEIDRLMGLSIGADDYVCKPFSAREVVLRIQTILRRVETIATTTEDIVCYKTIRIDKPRLRCDIGDTSVDLTRVEFRLLTCLIKQPSIVCSRDVLMAACYQDDRVVSYRTVDSHMKNLRHKIDPLLPVGCAIHSVYGIGYRIE